MSVDFSFSFVLFFWFTGGSVQHFEIIKNTFWLFVWKRPFSFNLCVEFSVSSVFLLKCLLL